MIWSLQILRFIAALMVVYAHAASVALAATGSVGIIPRDLAVMGTAGVDIFFVLSGVVIAKTAPGMSSTQFAWRRIRRIAPIYLVACAPVLLLVAVKMGGFDWRHALSTILLWPATDVMTASLLPSAWTLSFEMLFYFSATLVLYNSRWLYVLVGLYALTFWMRPLGPIFQFLGNPLIIEFLFGVAVAYAPPQGKALDFLTGQENLQRVFVCGLPSALIVYGFMQIRARESVWTYLGDASYTLYLFHPFLLLLLPALWLMVPVQSDLTVIIGVAASVLLAWRIHVLIEKPILRAIPANIRIARTQPG
jgi:exopolysaccharide production protein ExoZ